jgi:hypothetical protein
MLFATINYQDRILEKPDDGHKMNNWGLSPKVFSARLLGIVLGKVFSGIEKGAGNDTEPLVFFHGSPTGA